MIQQVVEVDDLLLVSREELALLMLGNDMVASPSIP
jgi:hypothetical protein